jgi:uncharacterized YigZ family protein
MPPIYTIPYERIRSEVEHNKSRFIASLSPIRNSDEARAFIKEVKHEFPDASHNVQAYILGGGRNLTDYCSDDGEPSGTAGMPVLTVLRGSGLGDVVVVVTRYFGGTLLGTGGLVKAYTDAAQEVIKKVIRAERIAVVVTRVILAYPLFDRMKLLIQKNGGVITSEEFLADVTITFQIPREYMAGFAKQAMDLASGKVEISEIEETEKLVKLI